MARPGSRRDPPRGTKPAGRAPPSHRHRNRPAHRRATRRRRPGRTRHRALNVGELPTEGGQRPQVVVTVSLPVLQGRIDSASLALGGPINADIPATHKSFPSSSAPEVNHSTSAAPATPSPPRSAAQSLSATADVPSSVVQYPPAGAKSITSSTGPTMVPPASKTASRSAAATTDSSTIPTGEYT
jgi:hypothetical protein